MTENIEQPQFSPEDEAAMRAVSMRPREWEAAWVAIYRDGGGPEVDTDTAEKLARKTGGAAGLEQLITSRAGRSIELPEQPRLRDLRRDLQSELIRRQTHDPNRYR